VSPLVDLVVLVGVGGLLWWGRRRVAPRELRRFAERFGVELGEAEFELVALRLRRGRTVRSIGVAAGVVVCYLPMMLGRLDPELAGEVAAVPYTAYAWLIGAAGGALVAEVFVVQCPLVRRAAVARRLASGYVAAWLVRLLDGLALVTWFLAADALVRGVGDASQVIGGAAMVAVAWTVARLVLRTVVDRPRLAPSGRSADVDDALRALGAHHVVGPALALAGGGLGQVLFARAVAGSAAAVWFAVVGVPLVQGLWLAVAGARWPVRHHVGRPV
jgi:hypothetical protein